MTHDADYKTVSLLNAQFNSDVQSLLQDKVNSIFDTKKALILVRKNK